MLDNAHSPLAEEELPLCSTLKNLEDDTLRTSVTSVASITSRTSSIAADADAWNFDLDDLLANMPACPDPSLMRSATTGSVDVRKIEDNPSFLPSKLSPPRKSPMRVPRSSSTGSKALPRLSSLSRDGSSRSLSSASSTRSSFSSGNGRRASVRRSVSFDKVKVREFERILGDNPCQSEGPSLGLGWNYYEKKETNVDKFESKRTSMFSTRRRAGDVSALPPEKREKLARKLGYTDDEIYQNIKQAQKVQKQRKKTRDQCLLLANAEAEAYDPIAIMRKAQTAHGLAA